MILIGKIAEMPLRYEFNWSISDFPSLSCEEYCYSPLFSFAGASWCLLIYPNGREAHDSVGCVGLYLWRKSDGAPIRLEFSLGLKTVEGKVDSEVHRTKVFVNKMEASGIHRCLPRFKLLERKAELMPHDVLTVFCILKDPKLTAGINMSGLITCTYLQDPGKGDISTSRCVYCKETLVAENISRHEKKCIDKPIKCPECSDIVALKYWYEHDCQVAREKGDISTSRCVYCKETLVAENLSRHEKKCIDKPIKCPECSDIVALKYWYEHDCQVPREKDENNKPATSIYKNKILQDLKQLFLKQENCDVVLKVKEREFSAHSAILTARSSVFAATFRHDMKEKKTGVVDIEDCDPSIFADFLSFIYYGDKDNLSSENVFGLFTASDKYDVPDLTEKCAEFMKENLSVDIFCETITLALQYTQTELIQLATDFFIKNAEKILRTVKWQLFAAENPTQSNEMFIKFLESNRCLKD